MVFIMDALFLGVVQGAGVRREAGQGNRLVAALLPESAIRGTVVF